MRRLCRYSPMVVLFAWAAVGLAGFETPVVTALGRVLLGVTLALHIRQELHDRHA